MSDQHDYTTPVTVTENAARIDRIILLPHGEPSDGVGRKGRAEVVFAIGFYSAGVFTKLDTRVLSVDYEDLGAAMQATLDDLEDKALTAGQSSGFFPAGTTSNV